MNITFSVDERVLEQARKAAQAMGKSLDQAVRDYLEQLAGQAQRDAVIEELRSLALKGRSPEPGWRFDRDEIYAPRAERRRSRIAMAEVEAAIISREGVISTQVLQEYFCVTTRKLGTDPGIAQAAWTAMCG